jgi:hypothetical protein
LSVKVNDNTCPHFGSFKGLIHGDTFALSFNIVVNSMSKMIKKAQQNGLISGLADHILHGGVAILQADDMIMLLKDDVEQARNLNCCIFFRQCQVSRSTLKIVKCCLCKMILTKN